MTKREKIYTLRNRLKKKLGILAKPVMDLAKVVDADILSEILGNADKELMGIIKPKRKQ
jgi:hypothetical protein